MSVSVTPVLPRVGRGGGTFASPRTKCRHFRTGTRALVCSRTGHAEGRTEGRTEVPARGEGRAGRALRAGGGRCELTELSRRGPGRLREAATAQLREAACPCLRILLVFCVFVFPHLSGSYSKFVTGKLEEPRTSLPRSSRKQAPHPAAPKSGPCLPGGREAALAASALSPTPPELRHGADPLAQGWSLPGERQVSCAQGST